MPKLYDFYGQEGGAKVGSRETGYFSESGKEKGRLELVCRLLCTKNNDKTFSSRQRLLSGTVRLREKKVLQNPYSLK